VDTKVITVLDKNGKASKAPALSKEDLLRLYRVMVLTRMMDERAMNMQRQGRIGFYVPSKGQEASHIGTAWPLKDTDWTFPSYRDPGIALLRGVPIYQIVCEWYGNAGDNTKGRQMPVHYSFRSAHFVSISSPIGTQISQAAGAAMAAKYRKDKTVVMTWFGDGATSSNDFHCGLNFAAVYKAPCVFVCENNQWAISCPLPKQSASATMADKAIAYGMPGVRVDGNDILAVIAATREAVDRARKGGGPTLIETVTYRMGGHSSSDDPSRYRDAKEEQEWADKDPIPRFQKYLEKAGHWTRKVEEELRAECQKELDDAIVRAEKLGPPAPGTMFEDVYREPTAQLIEQRDDLMSQSGAAEQNQGAFPL
jgi:pyruvate dehydrogenase E1 component alpha subunit